jgi:hypothetical protein
MVGEVEPIAEGKKAEEMPIDFFRKDVLRVSVKNEFFDKLFKGENVLEFIKTKVPSNYSLCWAEKKEGIIDFLFLREGKQIDSSDVEDFNVFQ